MTSRLQPDLTPELLEQVADRLGGRSWGRRHLDGLLDPNFGLITGFEALLAAIGHLNEIDLEETPLPHEAARWLR
jgi:hypothetical protein